MKTISEYKSLLRKDDENSILGMELNRLFGEDSKYDATVQNLEEKIEVIVQMWNNGINAFTDQYKVGSIGKAFYQFKLRHYERFQ